MALNIVLLFGSYRRDRLGVRAVRFAERELAGRGHQVTTVDAQAVGAPMLDRTFGELGADAPASLVHVAAQLAEADAFLIVCGEYNHSLQPGLANLLDYFRQEYRWRPSALVSYSTGAFGGVRAAT